MGRLKSPLPGEVLEFRAGKDCGLRKQIHCIHNAYYLGSKAAGSNIQHNLFGWSGCAEKEFGGAVVKEVRNRAAGQCPHSIRGERAGGWGGGGCPQMLLSEPRHQPPTRSDTGRLSVFLGDGSSVDVTEEWKGGSCLWVETETAKHLFLDHITESGTSLPGRAPGFGATHVPGAHGSAPQGSGSAMGSEKRDPAQSHPSADAIPNVRAAVGEEWGMGGMEGMDKGPDRVRQAWARNVFLRPQSQDRMQTMELMPLLIIKGPMVWAPVCLPGG